MTRGGKTYWTEILTTGQGHLLPSNITYSCSYAQEATLWHWDKTECHLWLCQVLFGRRAWWRARKNVNWQDLVEVKAFPCQWNKNTLLSFAMPYTGWLFHLAFDTKQPILLGWRGKIHTHVTLRLLCNSILLLYFTCKGLYGGGAFKSQVMCTGFVTHSCFDWCYFNTSTTLV